MAEMPCADVENELIFFISNYFSIVNRFRQFTISYHLMPVKNYCTLLHSELMERTCHVNETVAIEIFR